MTAHVVASIENLCASELAAHTNSAADSGVGSEVLLKHNYPAALGSMVSVVARVKTVIDRSVTFEVEAKVGETVIADGQLRLVIVARDQFASRPIRSIVERACSDMLSLDQMEPTVTTAPAALELRERIDVQSRESQQRSTVRAGPAALSVAI